MGAEWFRRLGDIPGLEYSPPLAVDRTRLPRHDSEPEIRRVELDDQVREYLSWGTKPIDGEPGGEPAWTSLTSPAIEHLKEALGDAWPGGDLCPTETVLKRLYEALELPGTVEDYHGALTQVRYVLQMRKLAEPAVLDALESLAWLDVRLVLGHPAAFTYEDPEPGHAGFLGIAGFNDLIRLYRGEGFLREALQVAELLQQFPVDDSWLSDLQGRLEIIRSEGVAEP